MTTAAVSSEQILAFLQQPTSYPHHPSQVEIRQTHASVVALAPPYVYKVKKHVNLGFLDFRTLEARKANSEREIRLNSRLCADLYIGVLPITLKSDGGLAFGGEGEIVDYALQMKQLPEGFFLDELLKKGLVMPLMLEPVLTLLKDFYEKQLPDSSIA